jgi:hypothetical protein
MSEDSKKLLRRMAGYNQHTNPIFHNAIGVESEQPQGLPPKEYTFALMEKDPSLQARPIS